MIFNELILLESLLLLVTVFYVVGVNLLVLLYTGGIYLSLIGLILFLNDADIYVGFLWVIDLGVGLIFFLFILHFTSFTQQKSQLNLLPRYFVIIFNFYILLLLFIYYVPIPGGNLYYKDQTQSWFFRLTHIDYYSIFNVHETTELNLLRDSYFLLNSFEFFIINFSLLFGLLGSVLLCFLIQRIFSILNYSQIIGINVLQSVDTGFFMRQQDFMNQQSISGAVRVWSRPKNFL